MKYLILALLPFSALAQVDTDVMTFVDESRLTYSPPIKPVAKMTYGSTTLEIDRDSGTVRVANQSDTSHFPFAIVHTLRSTAAKEILKSKSDMDSDMMISVLLAELLTLRSETIPAIEVYELIRPLRNQIRLLSEQSVQVSEILLQQQKVIELLNQAQKHMK